MPYLAARFDGQRRAATFGRRDHARDRRRIQEHLTRGDAPAARFSEQRLDDDPAKVLGKRQLRVQPLVRRKPVEHAIDGVSGGVRRQPGDHQPSRSGGFEHERHDAVAAQLLDRQHVGILAQRDADGGEQSRSFAPNLALADHRPARFVDHLDFVFDRDDVIAARPVDEIDKGGDQRALPARARPGDQHQSLGLERERLDLARADRAARPSQREPS